MNTLRTISLLAILSVPMLGYADQKSMFEELDNETGGCQPKLDAKDNKIAGLQGQLGQRDSKISQLEGKIETLNGKLLASAKAQSQGTSSLSDKIAKLEASNQQLQNQNAQLNKSLSTNKSNVNDTARLALALTEMKGTLKTTRENLQESKQENRRLNQEINKLQRQLARANANSQSAPVAAVQQAPVASTVTTSPAAHSEVQDNVDIQKLAVSSAAASSVYNGHHLADMAIDGKPGSKWMTSDHHTDGQSLKLTFAESKTIRRVHIAIPENKRGQPPQDITLYFSNGSSQRVALEDRWGKQRISIEPVASKYIELEFGKQYTTKNKGKNTNLVIAEVEIYGN